MIALLRGTLIEKHPNQVILEVGSALGSASGGVGYEVIVPISTFSKLPAVGGQTALRIHTHVREDMFALYGFLTQDEKTLFEKLIGVSNIGPGLAIKVLSGMAIEDLLSGIRRGEVDKLVRIPGVGRKTAERMVLELRDKLPLPAGEETTPAAPSLSSIEEDVMSALLNLGCARPAAEAAVRKARAGGSPAEFEPLFRRSLELVR
jgi:Holliday junction DNA helicase RuvA